MFALLFLFGFLVTAILKTLRLPHAAMAEMPGNLSSEGREIINDANTARLFELESELVASNDALKRFTETLSTTFAHLSGGVAIFDADKSLHLFNPALSDLLGLDPVWLASRPSIADFIGKLRESRHLPEQKNFLEWRRLLTDLKDTGQQTSYDEEWALPDGRVFRVTGQPHRMGAVAFVFEDISAQVIIERRHRQEVLLNHSILNGLSDGVTVISAAGLVTFTNIALDDLFGVEFCESLVSHGIPNLPESNLAKPDTTDFWPKLKTYVSAPNRLTQWDQLLTFEDNANVHADVSTLPDGSTLAVFKAGTKIKGEVLPASDGVRPNPSDPLHFGNLENVLHQREITFDHSGFDFDCVNDADSVKTRRILWYLAISTANCCRKGGTINLSSRSEGQYTSLSCHVAAADQVDGVQDQENVAGNLLQSLTDQSDGRNSWVYDAADDPYTVSFKAQKPLKLSAV